MRLFIFLFLCLSCGDEIMIKDQTSIVGISDLNPIQFWPPDKPTFNQKKIPLLLPQKFYQRFKFDESLYNRQDIAFSSRRYPDWDNTISYSIGDTVYHPSTKTRWISVTNANLNHDPNPIITPSIYWAHDPLGGGYGYFNPATVYNSGDRVLSQDAAELFTNPSFNGTLVPWDGNYNLATSVGAQQWAWDAATNAAKTTVSLTYVSTKGLSQTVVAPADNKYRIRAKGSVACSSYPSALQISAFFYDVTNSFIAQDAIAVIGADGNFDATINVVHAGVKYVMLGIEQTGGASAIAAATFIINLFLCESDEARFLVFESISDANVGNYPIDSPLNWDQVTEATGRYTLQFLLNGAVTDSLNFDNIRLSSKHQFITWLFSDYSEFQDARVRLNILDVDNNIVLAQSDCIDVVTMGTNEPYLTIQYTNSDDYAGVAMEVVNPQYYLPLPAHFYEESETVEGEDTNITNGRVLSLRRQLITKRLLNVIDALPDFMHKKLQQILTCDNVIIDDLPWKWSPGDAYNNPKIDTSRLSFVSVLLIQADSVLINLSKYDANSGGRVFSGEFANPFS